MIVFVFSLLLALSNHLETLTDGHWAVSLSTMKLIPHSLTHKRYNIFSILSLPRFGTTFVARIETVLYP